MNRVESKSVHLRPRLEAAAALTGRAGTVADIGCDHGRLGIGLLQSGRAERIIASDCSEASLAKARRLAAHVGLAESVQTRLGSGLSVLREGEAEAIAICGMGGQLIARLLEEAAIPLMGAARVVCQPMRGVEELRQFLWENGYRVVGERVVLEQRRYYQVFSAEAGREGVLPAGWPEGCFLAGPKAVNEPLFPDMIRHMLAGCKKRLSGAAGTAGEARVLERQNALQSILRLCI